jgi:hypothetical protein
MWRAAPGTQYQDAQTGLEEGYNIYTSAFTV